MRALATALFLAPSLALAAGEMTPTQPPAQTETTQDCLDVRQWDPEIDSWVEYSEPVNGVWDPDLKRCIRPDKAGYLKSEVLEDAIRELAYAGRLAEAQMLLAAMPDQQDDLVLTYWGFTHRKLGDLETGNAFYQKAIAKNPDNLLARSYMGQGMVEAGDREGALAQLAEIQARGGAGSWPEQSLRSAIESGKGYSY